MGADPDLPEMPEVISHVPADHVVAVGVRLDHSRGKVGPTVPSPPDPVQLCGVPLVPQDGEVALVHQPLGLRLGRHDAPLLAVLPVVDGTKTTFPGILASCIREGESVKHCCFRLLS